MQLQMNLIIFSVFASFAAIHSVVAVEETDFDRFMKKMDADIKAAEERRNSLLEDLKRQYSADDWTDLLPLVIRCLQMGSISPEDTTIEDLKNIFGESAVVFYGDSFAAIRLEKGIVFDDENPPPFKSQTASNFDYPRIPANQSLWTLFCHLNKEGTHVLSFSLCYEPAFRIRKMIERIENAPSQQDESVESVPK